MRRPPAIVARLYSEIVKALNAPDVRPKLESMGLVIIGNTPQEFLEVVKRDVEKYRKIIVESGIPRL